MLLKVETYTDGRVTFARGTLIGGPIGPVEANASSIRHPQDRRRSNVGEALAVGRMLQILGRRLEVRASGFVKHEDDMLQQREIQKTKPRPAQIPPILLGARDRGI